MSKTRVKQEKKYYFENAPIYKAILFFAIPTIISQLITLLYNWADTFFIGQLNNSFQISAVSVCHPAFMMTSAIANLFGIGGASVISRALGTNNEDRVKKMASFSIFWAIITSLIYAIIVFVFKEPLLNLLGATTNTMEYAKDYLFWVVVIGSLPSVLNYSLAHLVRSIGKSKHASFGIILGAILNIALDPLFIFAFNLEIVGAAIATLLANTIASLYFIIYLFITRKRNPISFSLSNLKIKENVFKDMFSSGISSFCLTLMAIFSNISINKMISSYDDYAVSGVAIAKRIDLFVLSFSQGLSQGILPLVGFNHAAKNYKRRNGVIKLTAIASLTFSIIFVILAIPFAKQLVSIFIDHEETINYGVDFLKILCLSMPITGLIFLLNTIFQATKETKKALVITLFRKGIVDIPLMILLNTFIPLYGIVMSQPIVDVISALIATPLFISFIRKSKQEQNEVLTNN